MQGSSPFTYQSPSFHSSSYLPKLEANFMKDFACCGMTLPSLHDLLQHYEEAHAQQMPSTNPSQPVQQTTAPPDTRSALATSTAPGVRPQKQHSPIHSPSSQQRPDTPSASDSHAQFRPIEYAPTSSQSIHNLESVEDMDMDDISGDDVEASFTSNPQIQPQYRLQERPHSRFGQPTGTRVPHLDLNTLNMHTHQGLRQSQPSTPVSGGRPGAIYHHNPTVSSVNTPTLSAHPLQQQQQFRNTPDSSAPGTPAELDNDLLEDMDGMAMDSDRFVPSQQQDLNGYAFANGNDMLDLCIDEPAKRLFNPNGAFNTQQYTQSRLGSAQYGADSEIARRIREQQRKVGLADTTGGLNGEEPKPFRCPVIGCEKAYKNQNGLKYHKTVSTVSKSPILRASNTNRSLDQHGHNNQQLHENADGTFSIVDPTTLSPYPGTLGMEKEKPYKCEVCGKRYKNLNGLKYHKSHSAPCNPEMKPGVGIPLNTGLNANVAGAGLQGPGEETVR